MHRKPKAKRLTVKPYTKGQLNKALDSILHPLFQTNEGYIVLDSLLHAAIEKNPSSSIRKFVRYNLPIILQQSTRKRRSKDK